MKTSWRLALLIACLAPVAGFANPRPVPAVWGIDPATEGGELVYVDAVDGHVFGRYPLEGILPTDTSFGLAGNRDWTLFLIEGERSPDRIRLISTRSGEVVGEAAAGVAGREVVGLGIQDGTLLAADGSVHELFDLSDGSVLPAVYDPRSVAGDTGDRTFFYGDAILDGAPLGEYGIYEINPGSREVSFFAASPSDGIVGMACDFEFLYLSDREGGLYVLDLDSGAVRWQSELPFTLYALGTTRIPTPDTGSALWSLLGGCLAVGAFRRRARSMSFA